MGIEILGLLAASAGASYGWWRLQRRRERKLLDVPRDPDLEVVLGVAQHEAMSRRHEYLWPLHLVHGLAQDETFVAAITRLEGDATKLESFAQDELDKYAQTQDEHSMTEGAHVVGVAFMLARGHGRSATCTDLWSRLARTETGKAAAAAAGVDPTALLFVLAHGMPEPTTALPDRTDVHVVLRNDDYTTRDFVVAILRDVFDRAPDDAEARMLKTHNEGRTIVGRFKLEVARDKIESARRRARSEGYPLWIGVEDC
ncbi:MAG TPA: ATP-dependent Clp protease adaptor ClpS [Kofleriaceae bacterium]